MIRADRKQLIGDRFPGGGAAAPSLKSTWSSDEI
jgi:hypothetical protein